MGAVNRLSDVEYVFYKSDNKKGALLFICTVDYEMWTQVFCLHMAKIIEFHDFNLQFGVSVIRGRGRTLNPHTHPFDTPL